MMDEEQIEKIVAKKSIYRAEWRALPECLSFSGWLTEKIIDLESTLSAEKSDLEKLAGLVLIYLHHQPIAGAIREEIEALAAKYAPAAVERYEQKPEAFEHRPTESGVYALGDDGHFTKEGE